MNDQRTLKTLPADLLTPVGAYLLLREALGTPAFLLESVERGEQVGRYSFLGAGLPTTDSLDEAVEFASGTPGPADGQPPFVGGAVGYLAYDWISQLEPVPTPAATALDAGIPLMRFMLADAVVAFDHVRRTVSLIGRPEQVDRLEAVLRAAPAAAAGPTRERGSQVSETAPEDYEQGVSRAKEHIAAGDAFQIVLSQRIRRETQVSPFSVYRALRAVNPSPYMFLLDLGGYQLVGSSPETHVRLGTDGMCELRPIAGTRPRGSDRAADDALAEELLADEKERAEHVMLIDLARNDLSRVCEPGSVKVLRSMDVERYSHVMHIVSQVEGRIRPDRDAAALLRATFPAGTLSGAPKVRAMQIISDIEGRRREAYAGAVGYLGFGGDMDTCIAIRTLLMRDGVAYLQAGAGIVADSDPATEHQECMNKLAALGAAIDRAETGAYGTVRVLVIDNYDSFTYNLVDYIASAGAEVRVERNDAISPDEADAWGPTHLVVSPGPGTPAEAGISEALIQRLGPRVPVLGVCLGHQVIVEMYGGTVNRASRLMHGKPDMVSHDSSPLYSGLPSPFEAGRYHSLAATLVPTDLEVTATTPDGEVMGVRHRTLQTHGVQFHPESVLTPHGRRLIENFLAMNGATP